MSFSFISIKRWLKLFVWLLGGALFLGVLVPLFFFVRSDIYSFRPRLPSIRSQIELQRKDTPVLPKVLVQCLGADTPYITPDQFVARCLLSEHGLFDRATSVHRVVRTYFWSWSVMWHLNSDERALLHCRYLTDGERRGVHHLVQRLHRKPLAELSDLEIAEVVVTIRSPIHYLKDRIKMSRHAEELLEQVRHQGR